MLEILVPIAVAVQYIFMFVVVGSLMLLVIAGVYMVSDDFREIVHDFEMWAAHRRLRKRMARQFREYGVESYVMLEKDPEFTELVFEQNVIYPSIFDAVVADHGDPRSILRQKKEQEAHDQETLDRASEYRRGITQ